MATKHYRETYPETSGLIGAFDSGISTDWNSLLCIRLEQSTIVCSYLLRNPKYTDEPLEWLESWLKHKIVPCPEDLEKHCRHYPGVIRYFYSSRGPEFESRMRALGWLLGKTQSMSVAASAYGSGINTPSTPMPSSPKPAGIETPVAAQASTPLAIETPKTGPVPQSPASIQEPKTFLVLASVTNFTQTDSSSVCYTSETCVITLSTDMDPTQVRQAISEAQDKEPCILGQVRAVWNKNVRLGNTELPGTTELRESNVKGVLMGLMKSTFAEVFVDLFMYHDERTGISSHNYN
ncbi:hypothetical protein HYFRA_00005221 [Hymenoscyphus fraxineus]|uniref:Uncharacterized protein n=1 Tax=Hymenoscyphus fraxineus TaxID=746836 RepID=A0A9N9LEX4_9HELO|nr:hypothetical protein HYFRA_00005221 [Hymenoscyphus fraxineus]